MRNSAVLFLISLRFAIFQLDLYSCSSAGLLYFEKDRLCLGQPIFLRTANYRVLKNFLNSFVPIFIQMLSLSALRGINLHSSPLGLQQIIKYLFRFIRNCTARAKLHKHRVTHYYQFMPSTTDGYI